MKVYQKVESSVVLEKGPDRIGFHCHTEKKRNCECIILDIVLAGNLSCLIDVSFPWIVFQHTISWILFFMSKS